MWVKTHTKEIADIDREAVWQVLTDINNWPTWHADLEYCRLEGDFAVGQHFLLKPKGIGEVKILLTEIHEGYSFTDCTSFFGAKMYDTHALVDTPQGLQIKNTIVVTGPLKWLWIKLVAHHVADSVPEETEALIKRVRDMNV